MPTQAITLRRWQAVGVLLLMTGTFVFSIVLLQREGHIRAEQVEQEAQERAQALAAHTLRVDMRLCQGTVQNREAVRATWNAARVYILRTSTEAAAIVTNEFFDRVLDTIPPLRCVGANPVPIEP